MPSSLDNGFGESVEGTILRIERYAIHDGPGIRTAVFFKGCPLRCAWCHSPESQHLDPEFMIQPDRCITCGACSAACPERVAAPAADALPAAPACTVCGACAEACPTCARQLVGSTYGVKELLSIVERDRIFFDESGGGVTFSGGEPLLQPAFLIACARACRKSGINVAVETCGMGDSEALAAAARFTDLFLFDLKTLNDEVHLAVTGASNRRILDNLAVLAALHPRIIIRYPLVPGVNAGEEELRRLGALSVSLGIGRIDLLPYHRAGLAKYGRLLRTYTLNDTEPPSRQLQEEAAACLEGFGLTVRKGGSS